MSWFTKMWGTKGSLTEVYPQQTDMDTFAIVKIRDSKRCSDCETIISKNSWAFGRQYQKFCLSCGEQWLKRAKKGFEEIIGTIEHSKKLYELNKEKYQSENTLANL